MFYSPEKLIGESILYVIILDIETIQIKRSVQIFLGRRYMKMNQIGGTKTDTIVKLILVFFISLLSFSVGTFVGKQFSDSQHRLASLENEYNKDSGQSRTTASIPGDSMEVEPSAILSNEDVAKLAEEFVQEKKGGTDEPPAPKREVANAEPTPEAGATTAKTVETTEEKTISKDGNKVVEKTVKKVVEKKNTADTVKHAPIKVTDKAAQNIATNKAPLEAVKPTETKKAMADLPSTVSADAKGKYTIQVSSHKTESEAKTRVNELSNKGFVASYISATVDGQPWYRVGVGAFGTVKSAKEYLEKVKENPQFKGAIVRQIVQ
jgi:septal ring-binding cell division protein DamX